MKVSGERDPTDSPCIGVCSTVYGDDVCLGCGRSAQEVILWNTLSDAEKIAINQRLTDEKQS